MYIAWSQYLCWLYDSCVDCVVFMQSTIVLFVQIVHGFDVCALHVACMELILMSRISSVSVRVYGGCMLCIQSLFCVDVRFACLDTGAHLLALPSLADHVCVCARERIFTSRNSSLPNDQTQTTVAGGGFASQGRPHDFLPPRASTTAPTSESLPAAPPAPSLEYLSRVHLLSTFGSRKNAHLGQVSDELLSLAVCGY